MTEVQRVLDIFDRQIAKEQSLIDAGKANWPEPPSLVDRALFIGTIGFTLDDWQRVRGEEYFEQADNMEWWRRKQFLLDRI